MIKDSELWFCIHGKAYAIRCRSCPLGQKQADSMNQEQYDRWESNWMKSFISNWRTRKAIKKWWAEVNENALKNFPR
jgi:hypothetical protein